MIYIDCSSSLKLDKMLLFKCVFYFIQRKGLLKFVTEKGAFGNSIQTPGLY